MTVDLASLPFDMSFSFGPDLREKPNTPDEMIQGTEYLKSELASIREAFEQAQVKSHLGVYQRILLELESSHDNLKDALAYFRSVEDDLKVLVTQIRFAHTLQWQKQFQLAEKELEEALLTTRNHPRYQSHQDFVLQHLGKLRFDQGLYRQALENFEKALIIREKKGVPDLIQSTKFALKIVSDLTI